MSTFLSNRPVEQASVRLIQWPVALGLFGVFCVLTLQGVLRALPGSGGLATDAVSYHLPQINAFLREPFNFFSYEATATTLPFYHALIGWLGRFLGRTEVSNADVTIRFLHFVLSSVGIAALCLYLSKYAARRNALVLGIPVITSWYVVSGAMFLGTDGPGLSVALIGLVLAAAQDRISPAHTLTLLAMAGIRHMMLPHAVAMLGAKALGDRRWEGIVKFVLYCVPAVVLLGIYASQWHGLTPPGKVAELNPKGVFPYALLGHLAIAGLWGTAFGCLRWSNWLRLLTCRRTHLALAAALAAVAALWWVAPSNPSVNEGRFGSLAWSLAGVGMIGQHSLAILILAGIGTCALILCALDSVEASLIPMEMIGLAAFFGALMLTYASYQRYSEPLCLASFAVAFARQPGFREIRYWQAIPLLALSCTGLLKLAQQSRLVG